MAHSRIVDVDETNGTFKHCFTLIIYITDYINNFRQLESQLIYITMGTLTKLEKSGLIDHAVLLIP